MTDAQISRILDWASGEDGEAFTADVTLKGGTTFEGTRPMDPPQDGLWQVMPATGNLAFHVFASADVAAISINYD